MLEHEQQIVSNISDIQQQILKHGLIINNLKNDIKKQNKITDNNITQLKDVIQGFDEIQKNKDKVLLEIKSDFYKSTSILNSRIESISLEISKLGEEISELTDYIKTNEIRGIKLEQDQRLMRLEIDELRSQIRPLLTLRSDKMDAGRSTLTDYHAGEISATIKAETYPRLNKLKKSNNRHIKKLYETWMRGDIAFIGLLNRITKMLKKKRAIRQKDRYELLFLRSHIYQEVNQFLPAIKDLEKLAKSHSKNLGEIYHELALCYANLEFYDKALNSINLAEQNNSPFRCTDLHKFQILFESERIDELKIELKKSKYQRKNISRPNRMIFVGKTYLLLKDQKKANKYFTACLNKWPSADRYAEISYYYRTNHLHEEDKKILKKALKYDKENPRIHHSLGMSEIKGNLSLTDKDRIDIDYDRAIQHFELSYKYLKLEFEEEGFNLIHFCGLFHIAEIFGMQGLELPEFKSKMIKFYPDGTQEEKLLEEGLELAFLTMHSFPYIVEDKLISLGEKFVESKEKFGLHDYSKIYYFRRLTLQLIQIGKLKLAVNVAKHIKNLVKTPNAYFFYSIVLVKSGNAFDGFEEFQKAWKDNPNSDWKETMVNLLKKHHHPMLEKAINNLPVSHESLLN